METEWIAGMSTESLQHSPFQKVMWSMSNEVNEEGNRLVKDQVCNLQVQMEAREKSSKQLRLVSNKNTCGGSVHSISLFDSAFPFYGSRGKTDVKPMTMMLFLTLKICCDY